MPVDPYAQVPDAILELYCVSISFKLGVLELTSLCYKNSLALLLGQLEAVCFYPAADDF